MDLFPIDQSGQPGPQNHAYDPGLTPPGPAGLVWVTTIPSSSVSVGLTTRSTFHADDCNHEAVVNSATVDVTDVALFDWVGNKNSFINNVAARQDAKVAFKIQWSNVSKLEEITDPANTLRGSFGESDVTMQWSSKNADGFEFHSDPSTPSQKEFALVGHERNGFYFDHRDPGQRWR